MSDERGFAKLSMAAVRALEQQEGSDFEVFLPGSNNDGPLLYRRAGAGLVQPDFERLAESGGSFVYVRAEDFHRCEETLENKLREIVANPHITPADKAEIVHSTGTTVARDITNGPVESDDLARASNLVDGMIGCVLGDERIAARLLQMADHERTTASHMFVVGTLAVMLGAQVYGDDQEMLKELGIAGMLHDLGKLSIDSTILNKDSPLTREELALLHQHPIESVRLIGDDPQVSPLARHMILQHHERVDGQGYPIGVSGTDLLRGSRLLCIVDSFHALIGRRCYRASVTPIDANRVLSTQANRQFDADLLACWTALCERHRPQAGGERKVAAPSPGENQIAARQEHRAVPPTPRVTIQRPTRYACKGSTTVQCIYAGRLREANETPGEFSALVHDVSRRGICIYTAHPMYRGEVINVQLQTNAGRTWVRSVVAWSRQQDDNVYRTGLKFAQRISESERESPVGVRDLPSMGAGLIDAVRPARQPEGPALVVSPAEPAPDKHDSALKVLAEIAATKRPNASAQRTVITLAMSSDVDIRLEVVGVLMNMRSKAARDTLASMLKDDDNEVRRKAIAAVGAKQVVEAIAPLKEMLRDPSGAIALEAAGALGQLGDSSGLPMVSRVLYEEGPNARLAARTLGDIFGQRFAATREGVKAARRYLAAKKSLLGVS